METMLNSFPPTIHTQLDKMIVYSGPPPVKHRKKHSPKTIEPVPELDSLVAQSRKGRAPAGSETCHGFPIDEECDGTGPASDAEKSHTVDRGIVVRDREAYSPAENVLVNNPNDFADLPDFMPELPSVWDCRSKGASSGADTNVETASAPAFLPVCSIPTPTWGSTGQGEVDYCVPDAGCDRGEPGYPWPATALFEGNESGRPVFGIGTMTQLTALEKLPCTTLGTSPSTKPKTNQPQGSCGVFEDMALGENSSTHSQDAHAKQTTVEPGTARRGCANRENAVDSSDDDVVPWIPRRRRGRSMEHGWPSTQRRGPDVRKRLRSLSSASSGSQQDARALKRGKHVPTRALVVERRESPCSQVSNESDNAVKKCVVNGSCRLRSPYCEQHGMAFDGTDCGGHPKDCTASKHPRSHKSTRKPRECRERRPRVSLVPSPPRTRRCRGEVCYATSATSVSTQQNDPLSHRTAGSADQPTWAVDRILRSMRKHGKTFYKVSWKPTWEPAESMQGSAEVAIAEFHARGCR